MPKNTHTKTSWECEKRHKWKAVYHNISGGNGCPYCSGVARKTEKDYHILAKDRGFKWVGEMLPRNNKSKTWWECKKGHRWEAEYTNIKKGTGCPICNIESLKNTKLDYCYVGKCRDIIWIATNLPKNTNTKTKWKCLKCNYVWEARYADIYSGSGCPYCSKHIRKVKEDYYNLANKYGFKWVGKSLPKNTITKSWWGCKNGHRWLARYNDISNGHGCPHCKNIINGAVVSKPQIKLNKMLTGSLNYPENKYRIDVAIVRKSQKIAVEYDAQYWHKGREKEDTIRDKYLISKGWKILHIKSGNLLPTRKQLKKYINYLLEKDNEICNLYLKDWKS